MNLNDVLVLARNLMDDHELVNWKLKLTNSKSFAGMCRYGSKDPELHVRATWGTIELSREYMTAFDEAHVRNTILHEIAHALTPKDKGHGKEWKAKAISIGCDGKRCVSPDAPKISGRYRLVCEAGHEMVRHRWSDNLRSASCNRCSKRYDPKFGFNIYDNGKLVHRRRDTSITNPDPSKLVATEFKHFPAIEEPAPTQPMTAYDLSQHHSEYLRKFMQS